MRRILLALGLVVMTVQTGLTQVAAPSTKAIITQYLQEHHVELGIKKTDLAGIEITDEHTNDIGVTFAYIRQQINQKPIFNAIASVAVQKGKVVNMTSGLRSNLSVRVTGGTASLTPVQAFGIVTRDSKYGELFNPQTIEVEASKNGYQWKLRDPNVALNEVRIALGYKDIDNKLEPVWEVLWGTPKGNNLYLAYVHAQNHNIVELTNLTLTCQFDRDGNHIGDHSQHAAMADPTPKVTAGQKAQATQATESYNVFALPLESPNHGSRSVVVAPADVDASPFGWHDDNGVTGAEYTFTRGNNVFARDDVDGNNTGGSTVDGGSDLIFDAPYDIGTTASLQLDAAIINLFYWNNLMHDVWHHYGFDEASGNFQQTNYSGAGVGNDFVIADAQDGYQRSGNPSFNNANFAPWPEGQNGVMQMFLWYTAGGSAESGEKFNVLSPGSIAGEYDMVQAGFGSNRLDKNVVSGKLVLVDDGSTEPTLACENIQNGSDLNGNIAVIDRGNCTFVSKIQKAQDEGAIAVIMINNVAGNPIVMGGNGAGISIPSIMISRNDGNLIKQRMALEEVRAEMYDSSDISTAPFYFDSDFDNGIIVHEYTHGISTRLTGGANNSTCLQSNTYAEQMGEGWSDFLALVMTHEQGDRGTDVRGIGTYVRNQSTTGRGIRPYPYSTSFSVSPVTYDYIKSSQFTVPHGVGSVWCQMLWDLYWAFIDEYGYDPDIYKGTGGNNICMQLVIDGMKLQPCGPGFVDGRDAIIRADEIRNGGKNKELIWAAFAKRGLGYSADQGSSTSRSDGTQAFDLPPSFGEFTVSKTGPETAEAGDTIDFEITITNTGSELLKQVDLSDSLLGSGIFLESDGRCPITFDGTTFSIKFNDLAAGDSIVCGYSAVIDTGAGGKLIWIDDFESDTTDWESETITGFGSWARTTAAAKSGDYSYFISDPGSETDRVLKRTFDLTKIAKPYLVFQHWYNTEADWDGAVIEVFDRGEWRDLGQYMIKNGYNTRIQTNPASAISGQEAFSGNSGEFIETIIDLSVYAGNEVEIRFRMVSDGAAAGIGWFVDDVALWNSYSGITNTASVKADGLATQTDRTFTAVYNNEVKDTTPIIIIDVLEQLVVFPNPFTEVFTIHFESKVERTLDLQLYDVAGHQVWNGSIAPVTTMDVPLHGLADGMYYLRINDRGEYTTRKLIKRGL